MVNEYLNCVNALQMIKALAINITMCKFTFLYMKNLKAQTKCTCELYSSTICIDK